jgi:hypothetical protein
MVIVMKEVLCVTSDLKLIISVYGHAITQVVDDRPFMTEARFRSQVRPWFVMDKAALKEDFLRVLRVFSVSIIPPVLSSSPRCSTQKDECAKAGNLKKNSALSEIGENWVEKHFQLCQYATG